MARHVVTKLEQCHANSDAVAYYAYFKGDDPPTLDQLAENNTDGFSEPVQVQDEVADAAGLQRWFVGQFV